MLSFAAYCKQATDEMISYMPELFCMRIDTSSEALSVYIDGQWLEAKTRFPVFNPATGEQIGEVADGERENAAGGGNTVQGNQW